MVTIKFIKFKYNHQQLVAIQRLTEAALFLFWYHNNNNDDDDYDGDRHAMSACLTKKCAKWLHTTL